MSSRFLAVVLIGGLCVAAAGGGAYLAVRQQAQAAAQIEPVPTADGAVPAPADTSRRAAEAIAAPATPPAPASLASTTGDVSTPAARGPAVPRARCTSPPAQASADRVPPASAAASPQLAPATLEGVPAAEASESPYVPSRPSVDTAPGAAPAPAPERTYEELLVPADAVIGLQVERTVSSDSARVEDRVDARVTRDVRVGGQVAIPAGARARGTVTVVDQGGKFRERARLGVRFHTILLPDGTSVPIQAETVYREGVSPTPNSSAKIGGGAIGGAVIGALLGGARGAAIGGSIGAGAGTAAVVAGEGKPATLASGSNVTVRLSRSAPVAVEKNDH